MINLKEYQMEAVDKLLYEVENHKAPNRILFESPTGSGKTIMSIYLMEQLMKQYKDVTFIWISIGKSGIHEQSKYKCDKVSAVLNTYSPKDIMDSNVQELDNMDVLFLNWEQVVTKNKNQEWTNTFMRDSETQNFPTLIENTRKANKRIFLIIDEVHLKGTSKRSEEFINLISPELILNVTATPKTAQVKQSGGQHVRVDINNVIEEGIIKKSILVNKGIRSSENVIHAMLDVAIRRRKQLKDMYIAEKSKVNPLCLIQIPNGDDGNILLADIEKYLATKDITVENGHLAIWITEEKVNITDIENIESPIQYLIFKQAIDTGWDCPRAQVLVKYRDIQSETFKKQVLGRILRMPELKHYSRDTLNHAYVFTNEENFVIDKPEEIPDEIQIPTECIELKDEFKNVAMFTVLPTYAKPVIYSMVEKRGLMYNLSVYLRDKAQLFIDYYKEDPSRVYVNIPQDLIMDIKDYSISNYNTKSSMLPTSVVRGIIRLHLKLVTSNNKEIQGLMDYIINAKPDDINIREYLNAIMCNIEFIIDHIKALYESHTSKIEVNLEDMLPVFNALPYQIFIHESPDDNPQFNKLIHEYFPKQHANKHEEHIIKYLENNNDISWWMYNNIFNATVRVPFVLDNQVKMYNPLFIAKLDNKILLIDYASNQDEYEVKNYLLHTLAYKSNLPNIEARVYTKATLPLFMGDTEQKE